MATWSQADLQQALSQLDPATRERFEQTLSTKDHDESEEEYQGEYQEDVEEEGEEGYAGSDYDGGQYDSDDDRDQDYGNRYGTPTPDHGECGSPAVQSDEDGPEVSEPAQSDAEQTHHDVESEAELDLETASEPLGEHEMYSGQSELADESDDGAAELARLEAQVAERRRALEEKKRLKAKGNSQTAGKDLLVPKEPATRPSNWDDLPPSDDEDILRYGPPPKNVIAPPPSNDDNPAKKGRKWIHDTNGAKLRRKMGIEADWDPEEQDRLTKQFRMRCRRASGLRCNQPWGFYQDQGVADEAIRKVLVEMQEHGWRRSLAVKVMKDICNRRRQSIARPLNKKNKEAGGKNKPGRPFGGRRNDLVESVDIDSSHVRAAVVPDKNREAVQLEILNKKKKDSGPAIEEQIFASIDDARRAKQKSPPTVEKTKSPPPPVDNLTSSMAERRLDSMPIGARTLKPPTKGKLVKPPVLKPAATKPSSKDPAVRKSATQPVKPSGKKPAAHNPATQPIKPIKQAGGDSRVVNASNTIPTPKPSAPALEFRICLNKGSVIPAHNKLTFPQWKILCSKNCSSRKLANLKEPTYNYIKTNKSPSMFDDEEGFQKFLKYIKNNEVVIRVQGFNVCVDIEISSFEEAIREPGLSHSPTLQSPPPRSRQSSMGPPTIRTPAANRLLQDLMDADPSTQTLARNVRARVGSPEQTFKESPVKRKATQGPTTPLGKRIRTDDCESRTLPTSETMEATRLAGKTGEENTAIKTIAQLLSSDFATKMDKPSSPANTRQPTTIGRSPKLPAARSSCTTKGAVTDTSPDIQKPPGRPKRQVAETERAKAARELKERDAALKDERKQARLRTKTRRDIKDSQIAGRRRPSPKED